MSEQACPDGLDWSPTSWQRKTATQQPKYPDQGKLQEVVEEISKLPPLVTSWEVESLKHELAEASQGKRFLLQGGDCSESFSECDSSIIANKLKILLQMSLILVHASRKRVIRVGRFAGQYAKPRSSDSETRDGVTLPTYRGDLVNRHAFTDEDRVPNPDLLLRGYARSALTLNFIRSLMDGGFADLHHPEYWDLDFVRNSPMAEEYNQVVDSLKNSLFFFETLSGAKVTELERVNFYTSHEGLHLYYEQAQTRHVPHQTGWYNLSTHFPWIGDRTRQLDGAHVEFFRGISNPIAVKVSGTMSADALVELIDVLNPAGEPGRLTLIHRFGADSISRSLPPLVQAVERAGRKVLWSCDPMHGNTERTPEGYKTRDFSKILSEVEQAFEIHARSGSLLGGVHIELTGDDVTECVGGARGLREADLQRAYRTQVDPRLNYEQALEMGILIAGLMRRY